MQTFFIAPTSYGSGLTSVALGMVRALERIGLKVLFYKPINQSGKTEDDTGVTYSRNTLHQKSPPPLTLQYVEDMLGQNRRNDLLEEIVSKVTPLAGSYNALVVEGLVPTRNNPWATSLNSQIARTLNANTILVARADENTAQELADRLTITCDAYGGMESPSVLGYILNKMPESMIADYHTLPQPLKALPRLNGKHFPPIGHIPWTPDLTAPRTRDICNRLQATIIHEGDMDNRRVLRHILCARSSSKITRHLVAGTLIITPGDRDDIIMAASLAVSNGVPLAGLLLTNAESVPEGIMNLCQKAISDHRLPVISTTTNSYETATLLDRMDPEIPADDVERMERVMNTVAEHLDSELLQRLYGHQPKRYSLTPPAFRFNLMMQARQANKQIVLPEGEEPRTVEAAIICQTKKIANCVLLGNPTRIQEVIRGLDCGMPEGLTIIDPNTIRARYVEPMVKRRQHKGLNATMAEAQLEDNIVLGTMMLAEGDVDGLVSGALHTTANTVRPAFQLLKNQNESNGLVSSVFFMMLPEQVVVYGDCAINPTPTAEELAEIALQSAASAKAFGIEPRVAMISYSTGDSGQGSHVEKVSEATRIARRRAPDLLIDGPLQYDAAAIASVAASKAPNSPVAGNATVFIFPDLNTGNTTYKAVQRNANIVSVGPMLQGLQKPVNDLSRGALVDDIVYTIALTAIQATQTE